MGSPKEGFIIEAWRIVNGLYVETSTWWEPKKTNHLCVNLGELPKLEKMVWEALKVVINIEECVYSMDNFKSSWDNV